MDKPTGNQNQEQNQHLPYRSNTLKTNNLQMKIDPDSETPEADEDREAGYQSIAPQSSRKFIFRPDLWPRLHPKQKAPQAL